MEVPGINVLKAWYFGTLKAVCSSATSWRICELHEVHEGAFLGINNLVSDCFPCCKIVCHLFSLFFNPRALMGSIKNVSPAKTSQLLNTSNVDLVFSDLVSSKTGGMFFFFLLPNVLISQTRRW